MREFEQQFKNWLRGREVSSKRQNERLTGHDPSGGTGHSGRVAGRMADGVNDDLGLRGLVENQIWIGRRRHPTNGRIVRAAADMGIQQQKVGEGLKRA